jgi:hypothetical protein
MRALKLEPAPDRRGRTESRLRDAPTMPAIDRYTGVLYDALDAGTPLADARSFASSSVVVHSALFGLVGRSTDPGVPALARSPGSRSSACGRSGAPGWPSARSEDGRDPGPPIGGVRGARTRPRARRQRVRARSSRSATTVDAAPQPLQQARQGPVHTRPAGRLARRRRRSTTRGVGAQRRLRGRPAPPASPGTPRELELVA